MDTRDLFQAALGLTPPWQVSDVSFEKDEETGGAQLQIHVDFPRGSRFPCPECGKPCSVHDTAERRWRHLNFFEHHTYLHARVPRTRCGEHGVETVPVPWAREGSGFTLLFEAYLMMMAPQMPMAGIARQLEEHDTRLWRAVHHHVAEARAEVDMSGVEDLVVDETSRARGQSYVTLFAEPKPAQTRVLFATPGRSHRTFEAFGRDLREHGGHPSQIRNLCMDMSAGFEKGAEMVMPRARVTLDRFHVMKLVGEAVDEVRRRERKEHPELKNTRYHWLKNPENLKVQQREKLATLSLQNLLTAKAYQMRLNLRDLWKEPGVVAARAFLKRWCSWVSRATRRRDPEARRILEPMARLAKTIRNKAEGIINYLRYGKHLTGGVIEGINSLVQAARARARGYRKPSTFITMIYLIAGRLRFDLPAVTH
jgi:transposase